MLIARIAPPKSSLYKRMAEKVKSLDKFMSYKPVTWFGFWTVFVSGMAAFGGSLNRYHYWDWSHWLVGTLSLIVITFILSVFLLKPERITFEEKSLTVKKSIQFALIGAILFLLGWGANPMKGFIPLIPYLTTYLALAFVHTVSIEKNAKTEKSNIVSSEVRIQRLGISLALMSIGLIVGSWLDDPVISTAIAVSLPFLIIALLMKHVRHLQRARFYPIFIMAMFVSMREPWFLILLGVLFYSLRFYHYFRYEIIYPTFGVEMDE